MSELLKMELHGTLNIHWYEILRVPGGWIYTRFDAQGDINPNNPCPLSSCFVPEPKDHDHADRAQDENGRSEK